MKKFAAVIVIVVLFLIGCASGPRLTPEMQRISSVSDTSKCQFIRTFMVVTYPYDMITYVQYNTSVLGGDSYKIIASVPQTISAGLTSLSTTFEIYKCK
jgi:hypothetical protein